MRNSSLPRSLLTSLVILGLVSQGANADTNGDELVALLSMKASLDPSPLLQSWTDTGDPCDEQWFGITGCTNETTQRVTEIQLQNSALSGTISPFVGNLTALTWLDMSGNRLTGPIPTTLANLVNITHMNLHSNRLTGTLQPFVNLRQMDTLNIGLNSITGGIPPEFNNLTALTYFSIGQNPLGGIIPDLSTMKGVIHLHFDNADLIGPLPATLANLPNMIHLLVQNNSLSGTLPPALGSLPSLTQFQVDNNLFTGTLPDSYGNLTKMVDFRANNNQLSGPITSSWLRLMVLRKLDLSDNQFSGQLPSGLGSSGGLIDLNVANNMFSGPVPPSLCASNIMTTLQLQNNQFSGPLPAACFNLRSPAFQTAYFHGNVLTGAIPSSPDDSVGITAFDNPWCTGRMQLPACQIPPAAIAPAPAAVSSSGVAAASSPVLAPDCSCPSGQKPQPYTLGVELLPNGSAPCTCVNPSQFVINIPGFSVYDFTAAQFQRLAQSLAATINVLPDQVLPDGACDALQLNCTLQCLYPPCSGITATFSLLPVQGQAIDPSYVTNLNRRLTVANASSWFYNKIDDVGPYTLVLAQPAESVEEKTSASTITVVVISTVLGVLLFLAIVAGIGVGLWYARRRSRRYRSAPWLRKSRTGSWISRAGGSTRSEGWQGNTASAWSTSSAANNSDPFLDTELRTYALSELADATNNFSKEWVIGRGSFGTVYRGVFADDTEVAVKRLDLESNQGEPQFLAEIGAMSQRLVHSNLVRLLGYCSHGRDRLLVYEFMRRGNLRSYLRDGRTDPMAILDWETRLSIACDATAGLQYLHEGVSPPVVHRDIKSSNILLDDDFRAKISDFGLAKLYPEGEATHITTQVQGTYGYLAPDYAVTGLLNTKSDVYSMGVVFLELFSGVVAVSGATTSTSDINGFLVPWARKNSDKTGFHKEIMDPALADDCPPKAAKLFAALAVGMCSHEPDRRPSMSQVAYTLELIQQESAPARSTRVDAPASPLALSPVSDGCMTSPSSTVDSRRPARGVTHRPFESLEVPGVSAAKSASGSRKPWIQLSETATQGSTSDLEHSTLMPRGRPNSLETQVSPETFQGAGR